MLHSGSHDNGRSLASGHLRITDAFTTSWGVAQLLPTSEAFDPELFLGIIHAVRSNSVQSRHAR